jgi:hypothetical protein
VYSGSLCGAHEGDRVAEQASSDAAGGVFARRQRPAHGLQLRELRPGGPVGGLQRRPRRDRGAQPLFGGDLRSEERRID